MRRLRTIAILCLWPTLAQADLFGASDVKIVAQLTQMLTTLEDQLKTLKRTYDVGQDLYALTRGDITSLDRVLNTELVGLMREKGWLVEGLDGLEDLNAIAQQIGRLQRLLAEAKDADTRDQLQAALDLLKQQRTLVQLSDQARKNLERATHDINTREASRITAENTAVLARAALAAQAARDEQTLVRKASRSDEAAFAAGAARIYQQAGQR